MEGFISDTPRDLIIVAQFTVAACLQTASRTRKDPQNSPENTARPAVQPHTWAAAFGRRPGGCWQSDLGRVLTQFQAAGRHVRGGALRFIKEGIQLTSTFDQQPPQCLIKMNKPPSLDSFATQIHDLLKDLMKVHWFLSLTRTALFFLSAAVATRELFQNH